MRRCREQGRTAQIGRPARSSTLYAWALHRAPPRGCSARKLSLRPRRSSSRSCGVESGASLEPGCGAASDRLIRVIVGGWARKGLPHEAGDAVARVLNADIAVVADLRPVGRRDEVLEQRNFLERDLLIKRGDGFGH